MPALIALVVDFRSGRIRPREKTAHVINRHGAAAGFRSRRRGQLFRHEVLLLNRICVVDDAFQELHPLLAARQGGRGGVGGLFGDGREILGEGAIAANSIERGRERASRGGGAAAFLRGLRRPASFPELHLE